MPRWSLIAVTEQFDLYIACLDDGNVDQLMQFYHSNNTCFMPPNSPKAGWCSQSMYIEATILAFKLFLYIIIYKTIQTDPVLCFKFFNSCKINFKYNSIILL